jgi:tetratricopeptide (TPR) repeat protein
MTLMLVFSFASAQAQNDLTKKSTPGKDNVTAPTTTADKTRTRRIEETSDKQSEADAADGVNSAQVSSAADNKGSDRLSTLRAQIEDAKTDAARARLERTLVDYLVALNRKGEAINELRAWSREERLDPVGFYNIGNALARLGDTDTAIDAYRKAIKQRHGNYSRALNNLGVVLLRQGRWTEAQESLMSALRLENFRYSEASYNLGRLYSMQGEADLAIREWTRALVVQPDHADAAIALARALAEDGSPERGLAVLDTFIARRGPSSELAEARREILFGSGGDASGAASPDTGSNAKAASVSAPITRSSSPAIIVTRDTVSDLAPVNAVSGASSRKMASVKSDSGKRAATTLRRLTVDPETYDLLQRARAAREDGRNDEATRFYRRVLSLNGGLLPPANLELSFVLSTMKRYDEAAATLTTLISREGAHYPIAYYHLGRQYEALGQLSLAAEAYEQAIAAYNDSNPQFLLDLSRVREKEGDTAAALVAMENYVRISRNLGHVPEWTTERLTQLRQKIGSSAQAPAPKQ